MSVETVAATHHRYGRKVSREATRELQGMWGRVDSTAIADSWAQMVPAATATVAAAQLLSARESVQYAQNAFEEQGVAPSTRQVIPSSVSGVASDGRSLDSLMMSPAFVALASIGAGATVNRAMASGLNSLTLIGQTQISDAGRSAESMKIATTPRTVWTRMLEPPSCSRCVILAGRVYRWNSGFQRHPGCDCRHIPSAESDGGDHTVDPYAYFESLSEAEQDRIFTKAGAEAIRDGGDIFQVVNSRRGMSTAASGRLARDRFGQYTTTEGVTRRGFWGRNQAAGAKTPGGRYRSSRRRRLMPEEIYKQANGNRERAISLLEDHGYITGAGQSGSGVIAFPTLYR